MKSSIILMNSIFEKKIIKSEILRFQWKNMCIQNECKIDYLNEITIK